VVVVAVAPEATQPNGYLDLLVRLSPLLLAHPVRQARPMQAREELAGQHWFLPTFPQLEV
jgi:hypothetical protein